MDNNKDSGTWLSAQQAVMPDGSEVGNLTLVNKKLPPLSATPDGTHGTHGTHAGDRSNQAFLKAAIDFAIDQAGPQEGDGIAFLKLLRAGSWDAIAAEFPSFKTAQPE